MQPFMALAADNGTSAGGDIVNITLTESNTLRETLVDMECTNVTSLTLHGPIGSDDLNTIFEGTMLANVEYVNLSDVTIVPDGGKYAVTSAKPGGGDWITRQHHYLSDREEIVIDDGTTGLGMSYTRWDCYTTDLSGVFFEKPSLRTVYLPKGVKAVGVALCASSTKLQKVVFPESVTKVRMCAFKGCTSLTNVNLGQLTEIEGYAFDEVPITSIDLSKCTSLKSCAFSGTKLAEVNLSSLPSVGGGAFGGCKSLARVTFSDQLERICSGAFSYSGLTTVEGLPADIDSVASDAFENTPWFNALPYENDIKYIGHVAMCASSTATALNFKEGTTWIAYDFDCPNPRKVTSLNLPSTLRYVGEEALQYLDISSLTIPENVEYIGRDAFEKNSATKITYNAIAAKNESSSISGSACLKVVIGNKVEIIPEDLLWGSDNLTVVDCEERTADSPRLKIEKSAFASCENLKKFNGFQYVDSIGENAFYNTGLTTITLGPTIRKIGKSAFESSDLKTVKCEKREDPAYCLTIEEDAFLSCSNLEEFGAWAYVDSIKYYAFARSGLKSIGTSKNLKYVDKYAFDYCSSIDSIYFNGIGDESIRFTDASDITSGTIGKDATYVPYGVFWYKTKLKSVVFEDRENDELVEIGESAFQSCKSLKSFDNFRYVSSIGKEAFRNCGFDSLYLPPNITSIDMYAFSGCPQLNYVYFDVPNQISHIFWHYDENTPALQTAVIGPHVRQLERVFYSCDSLTCLTFDGWQTPQGTEYGNNAKAPAFENQTLKIVSYALGNLTGLNGTDLILPYGTQEIEYAAFENVTFRRVFVPSTLMSCNNNSDWQQKVVYLYNPEPEVVLLADTIYVLPSSVDAYRAKYSSSITFLPMSEEYLPTGIEAVAAEDGCAPRSAIYYQLDGLRLSGKPSKAGIYIREQNGKREKVAIKGE